MIQWGRMQQRHPTTDSIFQGLTGDLRETGLAPPKASSTLLTVGGRLVGQVLLLTYELSKPILDHGPTLYA